MSADLIALEGGRSGSPLLRSRKVVALVKLDGAGGAIGWLVATAVGSSREAPLAADVLEALEADGSLPPRARRWLDDLAHARRRVDHTHRAWALNLLLVFR